MHLFIYKRCSTIFVYTVTKMIKFLLLSTLFAACYGNDIDPTGLDGRVVGGETISIENAPYQLSYGNNGGHSCGAVIISHDWAVCAAHCTINSNVATATVRSGSGVRGTGGTLHRLSRIINHERYQRNPTDFDISLLRVATPFVYSRSVQPIPLATVPPPAQTAVVTSGFGTTSEGGSLALHLQQVQVYIVDYHSCNASYTGRITNTMLCAGVPGGGKDACQGDSGGPLVAGGILVGLVSWGSGCARPNFPGIYTNVAPFRQWITTHSGI